MAHSGKLISTPRFRVFYCREFPPSTSISADLPVAQLGIRLHQGTKVEVLSNIPTIKYRLQNMCSKKSPRKNCYNPLPDCTLKSMVVQLRYHHGYTYGTITS